MVRLFRRRPVSQTISVALQELGKQYAYLKAVLGRLSSRDKALFNECESMIRKGNKTRAMVYACELAELRKLIKTVKSAQLAIERVILRLEMLREVEAVTRDLRSVLDITQKVAVELSEGCPDADGIGFGPLRGATFK